MTLPNNNNRKSGFFAESSIVTNCKDCDRAIYRWEEYEWHSGRRIGLCHVNCPDRTTPLIG